MENQSKQELQIQIDGQIEQYTDERLFTGQIGTLDLLIRRKQATANPTRYSILYLLYETRILGRRAIAEATGKDEQGLEHHIDQLLDANLIAKVPVPDGVDGRLTFYKITPLGEDEVRSDLEFIHGQREADTRFSCKFKLGDAAEFFKSVGSQLLGTPEPDEITHHQESLRERAQQVSRHE